MSRSILIEIAPELDEDTAEVLNADGILVARFAPLSNRAPAGTAALQLPVAAFEGIWNELEALHTRTFG